jgi:hypothetical protein
MGDYRQDAGNEGYRARQMTLDPERWWVELSSIFVRGSCMDDYRNDYHPRLSGSQGYSLMTGVPEI